MTAPSITTTESRVRTRTLGQSFRRSGFWIAAAVLAVIIGLITVLATGSGAEQNRLEATNPAPVGGKALAEVLRQQGISVEVASTLDVATAAASGAGGSDTTILVFDDTGLLTGDDYQRLGGTGADIVLLEPGFTALDALAPGVASAGEVEGMLDADCSVDAVEAAGAVTGDGLGYRLIDDTDAAAEVCLGSGDDVYSLISVSPTSAAGESRGTITVLGTSTALTNETITTAGNGAMALTLLGATSTLVWYLPTLADVAGADPIVTIAEATPDWVVPFALLAILVAIAAALWRGRRFGPLVIENLPVVVRASETMEGRARLYEKGSARLRALDALRIGAIERLARQCGLSRTASVDEVVVAVSSVTSRPLPDVRTLLIDAEPRTDADLVRLSDDLLALETAVTVATRDR